MTVRIITGDAGRGGIGAHHSPKARTEDWLTPPAVIRCLGGPDGFDLDPCASIGQSDGPLRTARNSLTAEDDGLAKPWTGRIWLNPPYTNAKILTWMKRMAEHDCGIALIFARTETEVWFEHVWKRASAILFLRGRLTFLRPNGQPAEFNCGAPSALVAYGFTDAVILAGCNLDGALMLEWERPR